MASEPAGAATPSSSNSLPAWPGSGVWWARTSRISLIPPPAFFPAEQLCRICSRSMELNAAQIDCSASSRGGLPGAGWTPWPPSCPFGPYLYPAIQSADQPEQPAARRVIRSRCSPNARGRVPHFGGLWQGGSGSLKEMASAPPCWPTVLGGSDPARKAILIRQGAGRCSRRSARAPPSDGEGSSTGRFLIWSCFRQGGAQLAGAVPSRPAELGYRAAIEACFLQDGGFSAWLCRDRLLTQFFAPTTLPPFLELCAGQWMGPCRKSVLDLPTRRLPALTPGTSWPWRTIDAWHSK